MTPPRLSPSKELLEAPIWTTWARYFSRVNQAKVLKYAHEIVSRNLQVCRWPPAQEAPMILFPCHWACAAITETSSESSLGLGFSQ